MRNTAAFLFGGLLLTLIPGCATRTTSVPADAGIASAPTNNLLAGMAEIDITPPIGFRMAGYFDERFSTGVHDPLKAKALVLRQGKEEFALVFCDLLGLSLHVSTNARAQASRQTGIPVSHIVISATHTHTGPLFDDVRSDYLHQAALAKSGGDPHLTIDYPAFLTKQLVKVIAQARVKLEPAELDAGIATQTGLSFNRRYYMKNGRVAFNPGILNSNIIAPAGPIDPDVGMLMIKPSHSQSPMGGVTVFAMHCDSTGGTLYSADYPFFLQEKFRNAFGPSYISAFGAGTCGNINHIDVSKKQNYSGFEASERNGNRLGETAVEYVPHLQPLRHPSLAVKSETLMLPLQTYTPKELAEAKTNMIRLDDPKCDFTTRVKSVKILDLVRRGAIWPMEVQVFRLDADTAIVCLPAENFVEFGLAIKKASPFKRTLVITICNDRPAYVPTLKAFGEGSYEIINSRVKPGSGEVMMDTAIRLLNELKP